MSDYLYTHPYIASPWCCHSVRRPTGRHARRRRALSLYVNISRACFKMSDYLYSHGGALTCMHIGGFGAEIAAKVEERCFLSLEAPTVRVTGFDTHWPYAWDEFAVPTPPSNEPFLLHIRAFSNRGF